MASAITTTPKTIRIAPETKPPILRALVISVLSSLCRRSHHDGPDADSAILAASAARRLYESFALRECDRGNFALEWGAVGRSGKVLALVACFAAGITAAGVLAVSGTAADATTADDDDLGHDDGVRGHDAGSDDGDGRNDGGADDDPEDPGSRDDDR